MTWQRIKIWRSDVDISTTRVGVSRMPSKAGAAGIASIAEVDAANSVSPSTKDRHPTTTHDLVDQILTVRSSIFGDVPPPESSTKKSNSVERYELLFSYGHLNEDLEQMALVWSYKSDIEGKVFADDQENLRYSEVGGLG